MNLFEHYIKNIINEALTDTTLILESTNLENQEKKQQFY